jgi:hypothetical protein
VSPATKLPAADSKATNRPSALTSANVLSPLPSTPPLVTLCRVTALSVTAAWLLSTLSSFAAPQPAIASASPTVHVRDTIVMNRT